MALATQGAGQLSVRAAGPKLEDAPAQANGDRLGVTLSNLRAMLLTPRLNLTFSINGDNVVNISGPDAKNGPLPQRDTYVRWIMGTNTALVYFHVKAWTVDLLPTINGTATAPRVVLANRYRVTSTTDENWYSRRHIQGQMIVDVSELEATPLLLTPDQFRQAAFLQIPLGFKRENIQVTVSSDNTTLDYSYVDQETPLAMGLRSLATDIEGSAAVGVQSPLANITGLTAATMAAAAGGGRLLSGFWAGAANIASQALPNSLGSLVRAGAATFGASAPEFVTAGITSLMTGLPKITATGLVRVTGQRFANKADLAKLGVNILLDRFAGSFFNAYFTPGATPRIGTIAVSQDLKDRVVEVSMSFISTFTAQIVALGVSPMSTFAVDLMNMSSDIRTGDLAIGQVPQNTLASDPLVGSTFGVNVAPPNSGNTRGNWLGALVVALLGNPGFTPVNASADPIANVDFAAFI